MADAGAPSSRCAALLRRHAPPAALVAALVEDAPGEDGDAGGWVAWVLGWCAQSGREGTHELPRAYKRKVLQRAMDVLAESQGEVPDELADAVGMAVMGPDDDDDASFKTVSFVQADHNITELRVADNVLAGGTGLSPWTAGFALGDDATSGALWKLAGWNGDCTIREGAVLELGAGTGAAAVALCRHAPPDVRVLVTDGDADALHNLHSNLARNGVDAALADRDTDRARGARAAVLTLAWPDAAHEEVAMPSNLKQLWPTASSETPRLVVGADITYEPASFPGLCALLRRLLAAPPSATAPSTAVLYCTERSADTMASLRDAVRSAPLALQSEHVHVPTPSHYVGMANTTEVVRVLVIGLVESN